MARRYDPWFAAAWVFLVAVVAVGFFIQARTIQRLERDEDAIAILVAETAAKQTNSAERLCGLLVIIEPDQDELIAQVFKDLGYGCDVIERG